MENKITKRPNITFESIDVPEESMESSLTKSQGPFDQLVKQAQGRAVKKKGVNIAFTEDPTQGQTYSGIYKLKSHLMPPDIIKQVRINNLLVASILRARGNMIGAYAQPASGRFDVGFEIKIRPEFKDHILPEQMDEINNRIINVKKLLLTCGSEEGLADHEKCTLSDFLYMQTQNGLSFGSFATENIWEDAEQTKLSRFRIVDSGTIFKAVKKGQSANSVRLQSLKLLSQITGDKVFVDGFEKDRYDWIQVTTGSTPTQAFTSKELNVYNLYPTSDIEKNGYACGPLEGLSNNLTMYFSIESYVLAYFRNGRAARGMMVIQSDSIQQNELEDIKQYYNASIGNVSNSFRLPIFGVGEKDEVKWLSTEQQGKDAEFVALTEQVSRNIMAAFNIDPDELPAMGFLSQASNSSALNISSNESKITSSKDAGLRPLIIQFCDFLNNHIFRSMDPELFQICFLVLSGLDAETREQEVDRLIKQAPLNMSYDDILEEVQRTPVGSAMGGTIPLNTTYKTVADSSVKVGNFIGNYTGNPSAFVDPTLNYLRDSYYFNYMALLQESNPNAFLAALQTPSNAMELLQFLIQDYLDEEEI
jgi:hypothetical protein